MSGSRCLERSTTGTMMILIEPELWTLSFPPFRILTPLIEHLQLDSNPQLAGQSAILPPAEKRWLFSPNTSLRDDRTEYRRLRGIHNNSKHIIFLIDYTVNHSPGVQIKNICIFYSILDWQGSHQFIPSRQAIHHQTGRDEKDDAFCHRPMPAQTTQTPRRHAHSKL